LLFSHFSRVVGFRNRQVEEDWGPKPLALCGCAHSPESPSPDRP
jgi:hypothetical protein